MKERFSEKSHQLKQNINIHIHIKINQISTIANKLELLNPQSHLKRGYSLAMDKNQKVIYTPEQVQIDDILQLRIAKGHLITRVLDKGNNNG